MRILNLLILLCYFSFQINAQVEFPKLNAAWCYQASGDHGEKLYQICYVPDSIIEINGKVYSRIKYQQNLDDTLHTIYYRDEGQKFYILPKDSLNEILLCDFSLNMGDTFKISTWGWNQYESANLIVVDTYFYTTLDGIERKVISLNSNDGKGYYASWMEGIGNLEWNFIFPNYRGSISGGFIFIGHCVDGEMIYPEGFADVCSFLTGTHDVNFSKTISLFPNPTYGKFSVSGITNYKSIKVYNSWGQELTYKMNGQDVDISHFRAGVYLAVFTDHHNNQYFGKIAKL